MRQRNKSRGYTLVEVLVCSCIFFVIATLAISVMRSGANSWFTGGTSVELRNNIIRAFSVMEKELRQTNPAKLSLTSDSTSTSLVFKLPVDSDNDGTILDSSGTIEWSEDITYKLENDQIIRETPDASSVLGNNIVGLQFTRPSGSANLIQVDIEAQKDDKGGRTVTDNGQIIVKMRN
jgi:type II secretory pathway pseudopilin PulG